MANLENFYIFDMYQFKKFHSELILAGFLDHLKVLPILRSP